MTARELARGPRNMKCVLSLFWNCCPSFRNISLNKVAKCFISDFKVTKVIVIARSDCNDGKKAIARKEIAKKRLEKRDCKKEIAKKRLQKPIAKKRLQKANSIVAKKLLGKVLAKVLANNCLLKVLAKKFSLKGTR